MHLSVTKNGSLLFEQIDRTLLSLLRDVPAAADPRGDGRALDRLYPRPVADSEDAFNDDWTEFVQPGLQHLFESAHETMQRDLERAVEDDGGWSLAVPAAHFDAWISALNQARLVLAERFRLGEDDMARDAPLIPTDPREFALLRIHLFAFLLENFIGLQELDRE